MKRIIAFLLILLMVFGAAEAFAETWTCPACGKTGNDGQFCPNCGSAKPSASASTDIRIGDYVYLGHWEQNNNAGDGAEKIRWLVMDVDGEKLFLLSEKALANRPFNKSSDGSAWGKCSLRKWLNNDFYNGAFSTQEAAAIKTTKVIDNAEHSYSGFNTASRFSGTTKDKVFLLSFLELCTYLSMETALCEPTATVYQQNTRIEGVKSNGTIYCWWWLRTSAYKNNAMVMTSGGYSSAYEHYNQVCVRPALWVDASVVTQ